MTDLRAFSPSKVELSGTNVVEASAGTGKTFAITTLFLRLLLERRLDVGQILVVTFTEAATAELRTRVRCRLQDALNYLEDPGTHPDEALVAVLGHRRASRDEDGLRLKVALENIDEAAISTIHGFCYRLLQETAFRSGMLFDSELSRDLSSLTEDVLCDYWVGELHDADPSLVRSLRSFSISISQLRGLANSSQNIAARPLFPVDPPLRQDPTEALHEAAEAAQRSWDSPAVSEILLKSTSLNRRRYRRDRVLNWCDQLSARLEAAPDSDSEFLTLLQRFCTPALSEKGPPPDHPFFSNADALLEQLQAHREASRHAAIAFKKRLIDYCQTELPQRKANLSRLSFDDLLSELHRAVTADNGKELVSLIRHRYRAALIDEFQDTDPIQFEIFDTVYAGTGLPLFLIGDPKQAIYAFRGADIYSYLNAVRQAPAERRFSMGVNYRSDPAVVRAVEALYTTAERRARPFLLPGITYPHVEARPEAKPAWSTDEGTRAVGLELLFVSRDALRPDGSPAHSKPTTLSKRQIDIPRLVAHEIAELLTGTAQLHGQTPQAGDIAILTQTNKQCFAIQAGLRSLGIASVVLGDESVFDSPEAVELSRILGAVLEPSSVFHLKRALSTETVGVSVEDLNAFESDPELWQSWGELFRRLQLVWQSRGFVPMFRALLEDANVLPRLLAHRSGERRVTNLLHLMELMHTEASESHLGPAGVLKWLELQRNHHRVAPEHAQVRLESDARAVKITTVHKSKGLEYPIVFCPYLWDGALLHPSEKGALSFHDPTAEDSLSLNLDVLTDSKEYEGHRNQAELEKLAENLRVLYVALTRAKHRLIILWASIDSMETSALRLLLHPRDTEGPLHAAALKNTLKQRPDVELLEDLERLVLRSEGSISVRQVGGLGAATQPPAGLASASTLQARSVYKRVSRWERIASFSSLSQGASQLDGSEGREHDQSAASEATSAALVATAPSASPITLIDFPRGAEAGNFFHELFEHTDFQSSDDEATANRINAGLKSFGFPLDTARTVQTAMDECL